MKRLAPLLLCLALAAPPASADEAEDAGWIAYNKDLLKQRLRDPESAEFRGVFLSRKMGMPTVCGEVRAKTPAGGYGAFERFVGAGSVGVFFPSDVDDFKALWRAFCR